MTFDRTRVAKLLYRVGFLEAPNWDDDQLRKVAKDLGTYIAVENIPLNYRPLFEDLKDYGEKGALIQFADLPKTKSKDNEV